MTIKENTKLHKIIMCMLFILVGGMTSSCEEFLEEKPSMSISTVETLEDIQLLLNNVQVVNASVPGLIEIGSDDYFVDHNTLMSRPVFDQQVYLWQDPDFLPADQTLHWTGPYQPVMVANVVLEALNRVSEGRPIERDVLQGTALFVRAFAYYILAQVYADPYDDNAAVNPNGILIRAKSDINTKSERVTVAAAYDNIIADLEEALVLLPAEASQKTQPSKAAANALLARVYLLMGKYDKALFYADEALKGSYSLIDFNQLNVAANLPFTAMNSETIYFSYSTSALLLAQSRANISPELLDLYQEGDLRKQAYFYRKTNGHTGFKGSYTGTTSPLFVGLTLDELYLIKAECLARVGKNGEAVQTLNTLLETRWAENQFTPYEDLGEGYVLRKVLEERRKELVFRGLRWADLRRLNRDERFKRTIRRTLEIGGNIEIYTLAPDSKQYTYLIPRLVVELAGVNQTAR